MTFGSVRRNGACGDGVVDLVGGEFGPASLSLPAGDQLSLRSPLRTTDDDNGGELAGAGRVATRPAGELEPGSRGAGEADVAVNAGPNS